MALGLSILEDVLGRAILTMPREKMCSTYLAVSKLKVHCDHEDCIWHEVCIYSKIQLHVILYIIKYRVCECYNHITSGLIDNSDTLLNDDMSMLLNGVHGYRSPHLDVWLYVAACVSISLATTVVCRSVFQHARMIFLYIVYAPGLCIVYIFILQTHCKICKANKFDLTIVYTQNAVSVLVAHMLIRATVQSRYCNIH